MIVGLQHHIAPHQLPSANSWIPLLTLAFNTAGGGPVYVLARRATAIAQRRAAEIGPARLVVAGDLPPCAVRTAHRQKIVARDDTVGVV